MKQKEKKQENPSPLAKRICGCGCGIEFQPNRVDQLHLNSRHYDFAYNNGPRKEMYAKEQAKTKLIRLNDRIADKFFNCSESLRPMVNLTLLKMEGFDIDAYTKVVQKEHFGRKFKLLELFNYGFRIIIQDELEMIEIHKL
jgi:hypothetical protein